MRRLARPLMYLGIAVVVFGLSKAHAEIHHYDYTESFRFGWSLVYIAVLGVTAYGLGLPDIPRRRSAILSSLGSAAAAAGLISVMQLLWGTELLPRFVVLGSAAVLAPWYVLIAAVTTDARQRAGWRDRVVLVDGTVDAEAIRENLGSRAERPAQLVATVTLGEVVTAEVGVEPLVDRVIDADATVLVLSQDAEGEPSIVRQAATCHEAGVRIRTLAAFYEEWLGKMPLGELERTSLMFDIGELHRDRYARLKRLFDLVASCPLLIAFGVALPLVALGDVLGNRGSLFYVQERVGRNGKLFRIFKFRSMRSESGTGSALTAPSDHRVTKFGRLLRSSHVDELPQVLNVIRGDLSFVGPRPEQPRFVKHLREKIPYYDLRHLVSPGITGWAQVKFGYASDETDALEKLQYDFFYLRNQGLALDLRIIGRTIRSVLQSEGR